MPRMTLLIIDMLNDFFRQHARLAEQRPQLVASVNTLVEAFRHHGQPILWDDMTRRYLDGAIAQLLSNREIIKMLVS